MVAQSFLGTGAAAPQGNGAPPPTGTGNFLTAGLGAGYHEALGELGSAGEAAGRVFGAPGFAQSAANFAQGQREAAATYQRPDLEASPWSPQGIGYQIAKGVPTLGAILAGSLVTGGAADAGLLGATAARLGGRMVGGLAGAALSYPQAVGGNVQSQRRLPPLSRLKEAQPLRRLGLGIPEVAALYAIPAERLMGAVEHGGEGFVRGAVKSAAVQAPIAAAQGLPHKSKWATPPARLRIVLTDMVQAALSGALQGAVFGGAFGALRPAKEIDTKPAAAVATPELDKASQFLLPKPDWNAPQVNEIPLLPPPAIPMGAPPLALPKPYRNSAD